jgi:hypothetical protein
MADISLLMVPDIDRTIRSLSAKKFIPDPLLGRHFSRQQSLLGSAQKRHGYILEKAILETLRTNERYDVWEDFEFQVPQVVDHMVSGAFGDPASIIGSNSNYTMTGNRKLQIDLIVFDRQNHSLKAYEIKRGNGLHDAGKRRQILRDVMCVQVLLKSYGEQRGYSPTSVSSHIIFYYGACGLKKPWSLTGEELDGHFEMNVRESVEKVNEIFRKRLFSILSEG